MGYLHSYSDILASSPTCPDEFDQALMQCDLPNNTFDFFYRQGEIPTSVDATALKTAALALFAAKEVGM
ncbi:hypothetical protein Tco_1308127 [Tanacetum coccineum]